MSMKGRPHGDPLCNCDACQEYDDPGDPSDAQAPDPDDAICVTPRCGHALRGHGRSHPHVCFVLSCPCMGFRPPKGVVRP